MSTEPVSTAWAPGMTVRIRDGVKDPAQGAVIGGAEYRIEDLCKNVFGRSWMDATGNPAALHYVMRSVANGLPLDDNVLYGKIGPFGHLVHISEIEPLPGPGE